MFMLPGYKISEEIYETDNLRIYRGYTVRKRIPVIIKVLKEESTNAVEVSMLRHEYEITRNLDIEGIIKPIKFEKAGSTFALIMKDIKALSLKEYIQNHLIDLHGFLDIAIQLSEILGQLHQNRIIHRGLKPENILIHPDIGKCYITDFSKAVLFPAESKNNPRLKNVAGTLEHMPPEQIGRLNISIDQRSDLYSLGVVFYEILTGCLPLQADSPDEWIHTHISQRPQPPDKINPVIPPVISNIIMKLLEKDIEERYQSAYGLLWDIKECRRRLIKTGIIEDFSIGRMDTCAFFRLPRKLYGREREKAILQAAFDSVCEGQSRMILVSGYPGVGKTMLINQSLKPIVTGKGYFIMGKFDQLGQNIPYAPFAAAFGKLVRQLMTEKQEELDQWKKRIMQVLGRNGAVITGIIPELEWIIGKQPPADPLPQKEAENRFMLVFRDFVRIFAHRKHPLVLFLDDLQWADAASIHLLKYLNQGGNLGSLLIVGAFRENEVNENQTLKEMLEEISKEDQRDNHISLMPLELSHVRKLVKEALYAEEENAEALSEALHSKSGGNPFYLGQLLKLIYDEKLLYFNVQEGCWKWELEAIQKLQPEGDVLDLLIRKLQRLPEETREIMKMAACIGNSFELKTLATVLSKSLEETASDLMLPVREGIILMTTGYNEAELCAYEFTHDKIQQAAYSLINEEERKERHIAIGRLLLQNAARSNLEEKLMSIMDHFNRSLELIHDPSERMELAKYNLLAGLKAKASAAYASARQYFKSGKLLLPVTAWEQAYELSYELHLELAQAEYLSGNVKAAEELFDIVVEKSGNELEKASIYGLKVILYAGMGKHAEAIQTGINALKRLGVKVPVNPKKLDYLKELLLYKLYMRNKEIEELINLPEMKDPVQRKIAELLTRLCSVASLSNPDLYGYIVLKTGNHALRYGNTEMASTGYFGYSFTVGNILGDYEAGSRFGKVCIELAERYGRSSSKCIIYFVIGAFITHWTRHASCGMEYLKKAIISGMEAGDVLIIGFAHCLILELNYILGVSLERIAEEALEKHELGERLKHDNLILNAEIYSRLVSALRGQKANSLASGAEEFQEAKAHLPQDDKASWATFYLYKMQLCYLAGDYWNALSAAQNMQHFADSILGFMTSAESIFYHSLTITAVYDGLSATEKRIYRKKLRMNRRQMKEWSESCKENFLHRYLLIEAETARLKNRKEEAMSLYDKAIQAARKNGYVQNEALANELAARFYLYEGREKIARMYMIDACRGYKRWGAFAKIIELQDRYPDLLDGISFEESGNNFKAMLDTGYISSAGETEGSPDMNIIGEIVENITKEGNLNRLLDNFLNIAIQSIGANKGYLILEKNGELYVEIAKDTGCNMDLGKSVSLEKCNNIPKAVIRYVARTLETVVLNKGEKHEIFYGDPYISESDSRSIVCLPLMFQGKAIGVLYLENSLMPGEFTSGQIKMLKLLSTQMVFIKKLQLLLGEGSIKSDGQAYFNLIESLTDKEKEVLYLVAKGMSNKEIAGRLAITLNTVKSYLKNIYGKLGVNSRLKAVSKARTLNILK